MRTRAERLDMILATFYTDIQTSFAIATYKTVTTEKAYSCAREQIISLFKDCVPERLAFSDTKKLEGFELCRNEMLKNLEEMMR